MKTSIAELLSILLLLAAMGAFPASLPAASPGQLAREVRAFPANLRPGYKVPTPSLNAIAKAMMLRMKSLSTTIVVPPKLNVSQPVEIAIGYFSAKGDRRNVKQIYSPEGNLFNWTDLEGAGDARHVTIYVTLTERHADGQFWYIAFNWEVDLDPLYDVAITPLTFSLPFGSRDRVGKSDIRLLMIRPDYTRSLASFKLNVDPGTKKGSIRVLNEFQWSRVEVSAADKLSLPNAAFGDNDPVDKFNTNYVPPRQPALLPGKTKDVKYSIPALSGGDCRGYLEYTQTYTLRQYVNL